MKLIFENKIPQNRDAFKAKVIEIADKLNIDPNWLMVVMNIESNLDHRAVNPSSKATGLIQFMPDTAWNQFGLSTSALKMMTNVKQLDYVYKYYRPYKNYITDVDDMYLITLYPNAGGKLAGTLDKPNQWAFPQYVYAANTILDYNKDGTLTIKDIKNYVYSTVPGNWKFILKSRAVFTKFTKRNWVPISVAASFAFLLMFFF